MLPIALSVHWTINQANIFGKNQQQQQLQNHEIFARLKMNAVLSFFSS